MGIFGFSSKKEVAAQLAQKEKETRNAVLNRQHTDLSNLAKGSQIKISVPFFDVFDPRFQNFAVPVSVHGNVVYAVDDIDKFKSINKTQNVNDGVFETKLRGQLAKYIKSVVTNAPADNGIQVLQLERKILEISELVQRLVSPKIEQLFGVNVRSIDITEILVDKESRGYRELKSVTVDMERETLLAQQQISLTNFSLQNELSRDALKRQHEMQFGGQEELQRMQLENQKETMRIQREEMQRAARLQTESNFLSAHQANLNADVSKTQNSFWQQGPSTPQMPGMAPPMPGMPPMPGRVPQVQYIVGINGQQSGPYGWEQLQQLVQQGKLTQQTYVWKQGMAAWELAGNVSELAPLFLTGAPGMPPMP